MTWPKVGKYEGRLGKANAHAADDVMGGPAAAPTVIVGATWFTFAIRATGVRTILLAPKFMSVVVCLLFFCRAVTLVHL